MTRRRVNAEARRATIGLWVALAILAGVGVVAYRATMAVSVTTSWVEHTHEVLEQLAAERAGLAEAESARRAHGLTGDETWLVAYANAVKIIRASGAALRSLTADNATQQQRLNELEPLIQQRLSAFDDQVERRKRNADTEQLEAGELELGRATTARIESVVSDLANEEETLLALRRRESARTATGMRIVQLAGTAMSFAILFVAIRRQRSEIIRRLRSENAAKEGEQNLAQILMSMGDGVIATDLEGRVTRVNRAAVELTGWTAASSIGRHGSEVFHIIDGATRAPIADPLESALQKGVAVGPERPWLLVRKDGRELPVADSCAVVRDGKGAPHGAVLVFRDASETERAKSFFRALVEKSNDGIALTAADGKFTYVSPAAARMLGCSADAALGTRTLDYVHPDDLGRAREDNRGLVADAGNAATTERHVRGADGASRWIELTSTNMLGDPAVGAVVRNMRDITQRKAVARELLASEVRFARLSESGLIGIAHVDLKGTVRDANDAYLRILGYSRADLRAGNMGWTSMIPPEWAGMSERASQQLASTGVMSPWENELLRRDGSRVSVLIGAAKLDDQQVIAFVVDLTDRKVAERALRATEEQLRQAQKMDAVGRLAGGVAHDFNNMLSVVLSYSDLLLADLAPEDPMRADIGEIRKAGQQAADLTRQLLMFSRQQVIEPKVVDLNDVLSNMERMVARLVGADVELTVTKKSTTDVLVDPGGIEQMVMNLVVNARDAMPTGGKLTIETADVVLDQEYASHHVGVVPGPHVMLAVTDTGVGMDAATRARIFEPFFTTKAHGKGTGLGLSTVFGIAAQCGGSVWVYSEPGLGTTFKVYLPQASAERANAPEISLPPGTLRGTETVLLVEDEDQVRTVARGILTRAGYKVVDARNAGEALLVCEKYTGTLHLLLSDVVMPHMSGPELAKRLSAARPEMRVLCMSGYTDDSIVRHGVLDAHFAFLQKPITPETLTRKVREVLDAPTVAR